ncbi:S41 family peptidase [Sphingomonas sp. Leaf4]|uniref:S41 family peptidase n=1 Tax=Sphingomonas sp. Leaf4 TaxID=2876553 RepID=UPI001E3D18E8|nr:S41 family peptidase [Sphingomonas sp. Leaf4]
MRHGITAILSPIAVIALSAAPARAQDDPGTVAAATRAALAERYVLPDVATKLGAALASPDRYRGLQGEALADRINADMARVTPDKHLSLRFDPRTAAMLASRPPAGDDDDAPLPPGVARMILRLNAGVRAMETLPGNIRMVAYDGFIWGTPEAEAAIAGAMRFLQGGDAYIIDLRRNGGGSPEAVAAIASYFVPAGTPLMRFEMRGKPGEATTAPAAPFSLAGKPLYVLTSGQTASAAEEFATHVSALGFGTLVGERTAGAGFRNDMVPIGKSYVLSVSTGRAISLKTGKDWERVGVTPAIVTPPDQALAAAKVAAMTAIAARAPADERREDERLVAFYRASANPVRLARPLADYAGRYGNRVVAVADNGLTSARIGRAAFPLVAVAADSVVPETDPTTRFRFVEANGQIIAMEVERADGSTERADRIK